MSRAAISIKARHAQPPLRAPQPTTAPSMTPIPQHSRPSRLLARRYTAQTHETYRKSAQQFALWCKRSKRVLFDVDCVDRALAEYIAELDRANDGRGRSRAVHTYYGLVAALPQLRKRLPRAAEHLRGWLAMKPPRQRPPLTWPLTCAIAVKLASMGHGDAAIATLLAFDCLLRLSEVLNIRSNDVIEGRDVDRSLPPNTSIRLPQSKTGRNQTVAIRDADVVKLVRAVCGSRSKGSRLFSISAAAYRTQFKRACKELGLPATIVPHSLRHGGATRMYMAGEEVARIKTAGRWKSIFTCEHYIQIGQALIATVHVPQRVLRAAHYFASNLFASIRWTQTHCVKVGLAL
jgi:integrase